MTVEHTGEIVEADAVRLDDRPEPVPVNPPPLPEPLPWQAGQPVARPVLPDWLKDPAERRQAAEWARQFAWHWAAYHGMRTPLYLLRMMAYAPRGAALLTAQIAGWLTDAEARPLRSAAVAKQDHETYLRLARERADRLRGRRLVALVALVVLAGLTVALGYAPVWAQIMTGVAALVFLAWRGQPRDKPIVPSAAVVVPKMPRLTDTMVLDALASIGINPKQTTFSAPIHRDGAGWRAEVELPPGVVVAEVLEKREKLAGGLRRPTGCVWPEPRPDGHPGQLVLWVGDQEMRKAPQPPWPLLRGQADVFAPVPFGTDQRGRWVPITLMFSSGVIGAVPRMGKTFALRELLLIAALDPRCELHVYDLKGTGDFAPLEPVAHAYARSDSDEAIDYALSDLRKLQAEMRRRTEVISSLPRDLCPESKVTPELASNRSLGLWPIFLAVDECQMWFEHPEAGPLITRIVTDLVKRGPALGIMCYLATQRPDEKAIPKAISDNVAVRYCLKVQSWQSNDMVLGSGAYKAGHRATVFSLDDKGIGLLDPGTSAPVVVRTPYLDGPAADRIVGRARAMREHAGTLTGYAAGDQQPPGPTYDLLGDIRTVFVSAQRADRDRPGVWSEEICKRLAELRPDVYSGWTPEQLAAAIKPLGLQTSQIAMTDPETGQRANRRGIRWQALDSAISARVQRQELGR